MSKSARALAGLPKRRYSQPRLSRRFMSFSSSSIASSQSAMALSSSMLAAIRAQQRLFFAPGTMMSFGWFAIHSVHCLMAADSCPRLS